MKALSWMIGIAVGLLTVVFAVGLVINGSKSAVQANESSTLSDSFELPPKAVVPHREFDFGVMDPVTEGMHEFEIRNDGKGPLKLSKAGKTCMCVGYEIEPEVVPPGESAVIRVRWDTKVEAVEYRHGATIATNDPLLPTIRFRVFGRVKTILGAEPAKVIFERIVPGEETWRQSFVFSQEWDDFEVEEITTSMEGLILETKPAEADFLTKYRAKCGIQLLVGTSTELPRGTFHEWIRLKVKPKQDDVWKESQTLELSVHGNVISRLAVYGSKELKPDGSIYFGILRPDQEASTRLIVRARDDQPQLKVTSIETEPSYIEATLLPYDGANGKPGTYYLDIRIPPRTASGNHIGYDTGHVKLKFDHPRIEDLKLYVEFAVLQAQ